MNTETDNRTLEVSWKAIFKILITFFALFIIFLIHDILVLSVFGLVIAVLFEAPARALSKRIPYGLAVVFLYVAAFALLSSLIYFPASSLVTEIKQFISLFPIYFERVSPPLRNLGFEAFKDLENFVDSLEQVANIMSSNILNALFSIFGGIASTIYVVSIAFFLSFERNQFEKALVLFFPEDERGFISSLWNRSEKKVAYWFLKILFSCLFLGITSYISFLIIGVNYPLSLAILGGAVDFIPIVGPALATLVIFMTLALESLSKAIFGVLVYVILQQIDNNIVSPLLAKKFTGLSPVLVLVSLTAGGKLFGVLGAVLMVPLVALVVEFGKGLLERRQSHISVKTVTTE